MDSAKQLERLQMIEKMAYREALDKLLTGHFQTFGYFANQLEELGYFPNLSSEKILEKVRNHFGVFTGMENEIAEIRVIQREYKILEKIRNYVNELTGKRKDETRRMQAIWKECRIWKRACIEVRGEYVRNSFISVIERI